MREAHNLFLPVVQLNGVKLHAITEAGTINYVLNELDHNRGDLATGPVTIAERHPAWRDVRMVAGERVGITKAVDLEWRFCALGSRSVSRPWPRGVRDALAA